MVLDVVPANQVDCSELDVIFDRGSASDCRCQRYRLARGESFGRMPVAERVDRLREQTHCGDPGAPQTSGLVARLDGEPVGWCAVAPRHDYDGLVRNSNQTAWRGRSEDRSDASIWAITCLFVRPGARGQGVAQVLATAAVDFARQRGARALEAYPVTVANLTWGEEHPGPLSVYEAAGFEIVHRPSKRRAVVRIDC
ncbi:MAG: GNAT family N-acetyltransferase [Mobilicoccus sp.]|nr:GNAT family N-acetyltransferase [Mobilicoccus sp.]